jgi:hypothetical protein
MYPNNQEKNEIYMPKYKGTETEHIAILFK